MARIAQIQETQKLLVDKEKPEKPMILARSTKRGEGEIRRIADRREDMPGHRDQKND